MYLSIHPSIYFVFMYLSTYHIYPSINFFICLHVSIRLTVYPSIYLLYLSTCISPPIFLSIRLFTLSVYSIHLLSFYPSINLLYLSTCTYPPIFLSIRLSTYMLYLSISFKPFIYFVYLNVSVYLSIHPLLFINL